MLIDNGVKVLGEVDCRALTHSVLAVAQSSWFEDPRRQQDYDVHAQTQSLILSFCDGWPNVSVTHTPLWNLLAPAALPLMKEIIAQHFKPGGLVLRAMMARLPPGAKIARHRDSHPSFQVAHRIHVPLVTNPEVEFIVGQQRIQTQQGLAFELNNLLHHEVSNRGSSARIHFIFDYAP